MLNPCAARIKWLCFAELVFPRGEQRPVCGGNGFVSQNGLALPGAVATAAALLLFPGPPGPIHCPDLNGKWRSVKVKNHPRRGRPFVLTDADGRVGEWRPAAKGCGWGVPPRVGRDFTTEALRTLRESAEESNTETQRTHRGEEGMRRQRRRPRPTPPPPPSRAAARNGGRVMTALLRGRVVGDGQRAMVVIVYPCS